MSIFKIDGKVNKSMLIMEYRKENDLVISVDGTEPPTFLFNCYVINYKHYSLSDFIKEIPILQRAYKSENLFIYSNNNWEYNKDLYEALEENQNKFWYEDEEGYTHFIKHIFYFINDSNDNVG